MNKTLTTAAFAGLLGIGAFALTTGSASAYTTERCDAYGCYTASCDAWGGDCTRISGYHDAYRHRYNESAYDYDRDYYYDHAYRSDRHWVCDSDGDDCHWSYY